MRLFGKYIDGQYRRPTGIVGRYVGHLMAKQHAPENEWTVSLLNARPTDAILEVGFGAGYAIQHLSRTIGAAPAGRGRLAGVDVSPAMVAAAKRRNAAAVASGRVDLRRADVSRLPFGSGEFDKAFSIHSIYFWSKPFLSLHEIWRVLKPDGLVVLTLLPKANPAEKGTPQFTPYSGAELEALLKGAGFRETSVRDGRTEAQRSNYSVIGIR